MIQERFAKKDASGPCPAVKFRRTAIGDFSLPPYSQKHQLYVACALPGIQNQPPSVHVLKNYRPML
jgi:hypothetical protein